MPHLKYVRIRKNEIIRNLTVYSLLSHSKQDWYVIIKEFNSLSLPQRNAIIQEAQKREKLLKEKIFSPNEDMYLTCTMVNLNIVASKYDIDPSTVCLCIAPICKMHENIMVI